MLDGNENIEPNNNESEHVCTCGGNCEHEDNDNHECKCKEENNTCTCGENYECENEKEIKPDTITRIENLVSISVIANVITAIFVVIIALLLAFNNNDFSIDFGNQQHKAVYKGKSISIDEAMRSNKLAIVLFYADWCPHCKNFAPTFNKLSKDRKLKKKFNFVRVNADDLNARKYMQDFEVKGFPTLYLVDPKTKEIHPLSNSILFGMDAQKNLKDIFLSFANRK